MTDEQICTPQVKMVVDLLLHGNAGYAAVQPNRLYRKAAATTHAGGEPDPPAASDRVSWRGQSFRVIRHPAVAAALAEFRSPFEAGTLQFFDAVLPNCDRMIDVGAYVGLMSLYAAGRVAEVCAFEASPTNFDLLARNVAVNDEFRDRIRLFRHGLGDRDERVALYRKSVADFGVQHLSHGGARRICQRRARGQRGIARRQRRAARHRRDRAHPAEDRHRRRRIPGVPALADMLAETRPYLHLSFHPFNLVAGDEEYVNTVTRIRRAMEIAAALAPYRFMYCYEQDQWHCIEAVDRMVFLREICCGPNRFRVSAARNMASSTRSVSRT